MSVPLSDVVFAFDFSRIETIGGVRHLYDYGPSGFHFAFAGGATDPTVGLDGSLGFTGAMYISLPAARLAEFYARMPTGPLTWLSLSYNSGGAIWSCFDGANRGLIYLHVANKIRLYQCQGGLLPYVATASSAMMDGRYRAVAMTIEAAPRALLEQQTDAATWAGAFGTTVYNTASVPTLGAYPGGGSAMTGRQKYLALIRGALSSPDLSQLSRMLSEGSCKPFCQRGA